MLRSTLLAASVLLSTLGLSSPVSAQRLSLVNGAFPAINCLFDSGCRITVRDSIGNFSLPSTRGLGRLQSRSAGPGAPGTPGAGVYLYMYRVNLSDVTAIGEFTGCLDGLTVPFGDHVRLDYDGDGQLDDAFVGTRGGLGSEAPISATRSGNSIRFEFQWVCSGESSFFFGIASRRAPADVTAQIDSEYPEANLDVPARAPQPAVIAANFTRGDIDGTGRLEIGDAIGILDFLFRGGEQPICLDAADVNDDGAVQMTDAVGILSHLFIAGAPPAAPYPACGTDRSSDRLGCAATPSVCGEPECPDPAVRSLQFSIVRRDSRFQGRIRITGSVRNLGGAYRSRSGQQSVILEEIPAGGRARIVARNNFVNLDAGQNLSVSWERDWNSSSPAEGEFPPNYRVRISYDPDIRIDGNEQNDDCDNGNNSLERNGQDINDMLR